MDKFRSNNEDSCLSPISFSIFERFYNSSWISESILSSVLTFVEVLIIFYSNYSIGSKLWLWENMRIFIENYIFEFINKSAEMLNKTKSYLVLFKLGKQLFIRLKYIKYEYNFKINPFYYEMRISYIWAFTKFNKIEKL